MNENATAQREKIAAAKKELAERQAAIDTALDTSMIPTPQQIRETGVLSAAEEYKLSAPQLRKYLANYTKMQAEDAASHKRSKNNARRNLKSGSEQHKAALPKNHELPPGTWFL